MAVIMYYMINCGVAQINDPAAVLQRNYLLSQILTPNKLRLHAPNPANIIGHVVDVRLIDVNYC